MSGIATNTGLEPRAVASPRTVFRWAAAAVVSASPLLMLLGTTDWFLKNNSIDPWHYVGFFHAWANDGYSAGAYKIGRLPWILAGWTIDHVASGVAAAYLLHGVFLLASTFGFFVLVNDLFGSFRLALLGAALLGFHPSFHGSGGWDYHNTAAGAFYIWALAITTHAALSGSTARAVAAGVISTLAVHSNITYVNFAPVLVAHYLVVARGQNGRWPDRRTIVVTAAAAAIGALGITALLMAINASVGRDPVFFRQVLSLALGFASDTSTLAGYWHPWSSGWFWLRYHLALPVAMALVALPCLGITWRTPGETARRQRLVIGEFLFVAVMWTAWQFAGNITLDWDYFAYPIQPHVLLALVAMIGLTLPTVPAWLPPVAPFALLVPLMFGWGPSLVVAIGHSALMRSAVFFVAAAAVLMIRIPLRAALFIGLFTIGNVLATDQWPFYSIYAPCHTVASSYSVVVSAGNFLFDIDPTLNETRLWFDESETAQTSDGCSFGTAQIGYALAGMGVPYLATPFPMPPLSKVPDAAFTASSTSELFVAVVAKNPQAPQAFQERARAAGVTVSPRTARGFSFAGGTFQVTVMKFGEDVERVRKVARLPGGVLAKWEDDSLRKQFEVNSYASPRKTILESDGRSQLRFVPATVQDHLALPFVEVPAAEDSRQLVVRTSRDSAIEVNCTAFVQDQQMRVFGTVKCGEPDSAVHESLIAVPADVTSLRIYFLSNDLRPMVLPRRVELDYHHGDPD
jgi:hypothetical protein